MEVDEIPSDACGNDEEANDGVANNVEILRSTHSLPLEFGMEFESDEHAILYYKKYAESVGFSTRKEYVNKNKAGCVTSRKVTCFKEGYRGKDRRDVLVKNPRKDTRTGCLAHIVISRDQLSGKYRITSLEPEHNHPLDPKGSEHASQKKVKKVQAHAVGLSDDSEICPKNLHMTRQNGERAYFGSSYNYQRYCLHTKRQKDMKLGEACNLLQYFERRKLEDPSFFFSIQLDVDDLITNIFWADVKMIVDHKLFGDVVSFDTTYIRDGNYRPLGLFAGINNYREMVLFGAALIYDETVESFQWLFETFLRTMSDRKPKTILTDEDATISKAISLVMPEANHRLCVWHIEQNAVKHLNDVFLSSDSFKKDFYQCIHEFEEENEFLTAWEVILENYNLRDNDWLKGIFALREKWAMVYGRSAFSAGVRSTQLNENFTAALRDYLKSDEDLVRFCEHLERTVDDMRYKELEVSSGMTRRSPCLKVDLPLLIHARDVYTSVIFEMFQDEWVKSMHVVVNSRTINGTSHIYKASMLPHPREYTIIAKPLDAIVSCSCKKFEYLGILCSHALKILDLMNLKLMIPSHFILKRWTKDARVGSIDNVGDIQEEDHILKVANRYRMLCPTFVQIAARASESKAGYELAAKYANEMAEKLEAVIKAEQSREAPAAASISLETFDFENNHVGDSGIVPDVSNATWQSLVAECDVPVLVEFWAPWSGPCRMIHPVVAKLSKVYESRLRCFKLNTDESTEIAARYEIGSIPAIVIFKNGEKKDTVIGVVPESTLVSCIEKFLGAASWFSLFRN